MIILYLLFLFSSFFIKKMCEVGRARTSDKYSHVFF